MQRVVTRFASVLSLFAAFLVTAVVLGVLAAGLLMPAIGATGAVTRQGVHMFDSLPGDLKTSPLSQQSRILAADGSVLATPSDQYRIVVPLSKVAPVMRRAQVAIEDDRFYQHGGIDLKGIGRATVFNLFSSTTQGASTLTQQYVKLELQNRAIAEGNQQAAADAVSRSGVTGYVRKLQELKYAVTLEKTESKNDILSKYLNLVYYGDQAYGIEAAARHYFSIHASQLNLPQAALLAGLVNAPTSTDPVNYPQGAVARRNVVLHKLWTLHEITTAKYKAARASTLRLNLTYPKSTCAASKYPYFCSYVISWLKQQPSLGNTPTARLNMLNQSGLTVQTTIDPKMMAVAQKELKARVPTVNKLGLSDAAAVIQPGTGNIEAIAQNTPYVGTTKNGATQVDYASDSAYGGSGGFSYGSTAKMFAVVTALGSGMNALSTVFAKPATQTQPATFTSSDIPGPCGLGPGQVYKVKNDEGNASGNISLTKATADSINTAFTGLVGKLGACNVRDTMTKMGLHQANGDPIRSLPASITLGADGVSPLTLASAYATLAAQGKYCVPTPVTSITGPDGKALKIPKSQCKQVIGADVANATTAILTHVLNDHGATAAADRLSGGRDAAGKTGTSDGGSETWFVGYTPQAATAVWVGNPKTPNVSYRDVTVNGKFYSGQLFGATIAAPIWKSIMDGVLKGKPNEPFQKSTDKLMHGDSTNIPNVVGMSTGDAQSALQDAGFKVQVGSPVDSSYVKGTIVFTSPGAGTRARSGTEVTIYPASGYQIVTQAPTQSTTSSPSPPSSTSPPSSPSPTHSPSPSPTHSPSPSPSSPVHPTAPSPPKGPSSTSH